MTIYILTLLYTFDLTEDERVTSETCRKEKPCQKFLVRNAIRDINEIEITSIITYTNISTNLPFSFSTLLTFFSLKLNIPNSFTFQLRISKLSEIPFHLNTALVFSLLVMELSVVGSQPTRKISRPNCRLVFVQPDS